MTDRELLELAAKAAGYRTDLPINAERQDMAGLLINDNDITTKWSPLEDDDHAMRLAAKLLVSVSFHLPLNGSEVVTAHSPKIGKGCFEFAPVKSDWCAATRRAIVLCAAKIGEEMP